MDLLLAIGDLWTRRRARPCADALWRVRQLSPATVITGAAEGLGLALASIIAGEGRTVVLLARAQDALEAAKERLRRKYPSARVIAVQVDAGQPDAPDLIDAVLAKSGLYLDVLVNNAGIGIGGEFCTLAPEKLEELVQTNVTAVTRLTRHYLPAMRARARGGIMNIASIAAFTPGPWQSVYFASKAYILSLTAAIGSECSGEGVRICVLAPGPIETRIHEKMGTSTTFYRALLPSASPDRMARLAWRSYRLGRRVVVPGLLNSCLAWSARALPYELIVPFVGWLMKPRASEGRLRKNAIGTRPGGRGTES